MSTGRLARIAERVSAPEDPSGAGGAAPDHPRPDRLAALAAWWHSAGPTVRPGQVAQLWPGPPTVSFAGTAGIVVGRFAAPTEARAAVAWGVATADDAVDDGADLLLVSVPDPSPDQVDTRVLGAHLLSLDAVQAVGWPEATGLDDDAWVRRVAATRDGLRRVAGIRGDPDRLLEHLGNPALSAGTALLLEAAARRTPAVLDGPGAAACALLAVRAARPARTWWQAADLSGDPLHDRLLTELRLEPLTRFGLTDLDDLPGGDGTAARIVLALLEAALERAGTEPAESGPATGGDVPAERPTPDQPASEESAAGRGPE